MSESPRRDSLMERVEQVRLERAALIAFAVSLVALAIALPVVTDFSPDSWTLLQLARSVGHDFFRISVSREYASGSAYSSAFAPLWPVFASPFVALIGNVYGLYVAALVAYAAFAVAAEAFARRVFAQRGLGLLSALLLLRFTAVREEIGAGRSIPLYLCLFALAGLVLPGLRSARPGRAFVAGLAVGLLVLTRFDAMPAALLLLFAMPFIGVRGRRFAIALAGFAIALSPWVAYSLAHFHAPFATDNRVVALALDPSAFVLDFHATAPRTLHDSPTVWGAKIVAHVRPIAAAAVRACIHSLFLVPLLVLAAWSAFARRQTPTADGGDGPWRSPEDRRVFVVLALASIAPVAGYLITGYDDERYFAVALWIAELALLGFLARRVSRLQVGRLSLLALVIAGALINVVVVRYALARPPAAAVHATLDSADVASLSRCLSAARADTATPVMVSAAAHVNAFRFAAFTGQRTLPEPSNWTKLTPDERRAFFTRFGVAFVVDDERGLTTASAPHGERVACALPLTRIAPPAAASVAAP